MKPTNKLPHVIERSIHFIGVTRYFSDHQPEDVSLFGISYTRSSDLRNGLRCRKTGSDSWKQSLSSYKNYKKNFFSVSRPWEKNFQLFFNFFHDSSFLCYNLQKDSFSPQEEMLKKRCLHSPLKSVNLQETVVHKSDRLNLFNCEGDSRMDYVGLGRTGLRVSRLCLGTMNFGPETSEKESHAIMDKALELGINFLIPPTSTAGSVGRDGPSRLSAGGWRRGEDGATRLSWRRRCTAAWESGKTSGASRPIISGAPAKRACVGCRPTTSISTRCTTSIQRPPGKRSGRRWSSWSSREKSFISAAATSLPGRSRPQINSHRNATSWDWSASRASTVFKTG